jgi:hypothetical protein
VTLARLLLVVLAAAVAAPALADPAASSKPVKSTPISGPTNGDKLLAQDAKAGSGPPPAGGLWTRRRVHVDPETGAQTTTVIVASHPFPDLKPKQP